MTAVRDVAWLKRQAGGHATTLVESGMVCGLGSGSTAIFATCRIAERLRDGDLKDIIAIASPTLPGRKRANSASRC